MRTSLTVIAVLIGTLFSVACSQPTSPSIPTSMPVSLSGTSSPLNGTVAAVTSGVHGEKRAVTDETLANAGWTCIQPGNGLTLCFTPGGGTPPIPPTGDGAPTYTFMAFTADHEFVHRVTLRRPDLYHGEPCLGGDPWSYFALIDYFECINPTP